MTIIPAIRPERMRPVRLPLLLLALVVAVPFLPSPVQAQHLFQSARSYAPGLPPRGLDTADLDHDGRLDVLFATDEGLVCLRGRGNGTFSEAWSTALEPEGGSSVHLVDLDGDGHEDALFEWSPDEVAVMMGRGDGTFDEPAGFTAALEVHGLAVAPLDGDDHHDLVVVDREADAVIIYRGDGAGGFTEHETLQFEWDSYVPYPFDPDGDGDLDILLRRSVNYVSDGMVLLLNDGDGHFPGLVELLPGVAVGGAAAGHLDGDGHVDLAFSYFLGDDVGILTGNGDGTFSAPVLYDVLPQPNFLTLVDLDGDGRLDVAAKMNRDTDDEAYPTLIGVLPGDGQGGFGALQTWFAGDPGSFSFHDLDGDGHLDALLNLYRNRAFGVLPGEEGGFADQPRYNCPGSSTGGCRYVTAGDLQGDGHTDLVVTPNSGGRAYLFPGQGDGTLGGYSSLFYAPGAASVTLLDLQGDGDRDLAVPCGTGGLNIYFNDGSGGLGSPVTYEPGGWPETASTADFDGDGFDDLALLDRVGDALFIYHAAADGQLTLAQTCPGGNNSFTSVAGDLDGDGFPELVLDDNNGGLRLYLNRGDGTFEAPQNLGGWDTRGVAVGDLDGDGFADIAAGRSLGDEVIFLAGRGDGTFDEPLSLAAGHSPEALAIADLTGDGWPDLAAVCEASEDLVLWSGPITAVHNAPRHYPTGPSPRQLVVADLLEDGRPDVAVSAADSSQIHLLLNEGLFVGRVLTGPGPGPGCPPLVRVFSPAEGTAPLAEWAAYGATGYGVNVALGHLDPDGEADVLTGPGPGAVYGPHVRGFTLHGRPFPGCSFLAYGTNRFGVNVACGDLDGDGLDELVTGAGPGAVFGPHVRAWNWDGAGAVAAIPGLSWFAYGTPRWGVNVACGDLDGDGLSEIVTGPGPGAVYGPHVRGWDVDGGTLQPLHEVSLMAYGTSRFGVRIACGDVDGDGIDEIVTGAGPGVMFGPHVRGWNWDGAGSAAAIPGISFFAYAGTLYGVNVSCGDLDGDGIDEILTGPGRDPDAGARVRGWNFDGQALDPMGEVDFEAYVEAGAEAGVKVAALPATP